MAEARRAWSGEPLLEPIAVFLDLNLPDGSGEELLPLIRSRYPKTPVVALGADVKASRAIALLAFGIPVLPKPVAADEFSELLLVYKEGRTRLKSPSDQPPILHSPAASLETYAGFRQLSSRQALILELYLAGTHDKEIASQLGCGAATVQEHWRRMAKKAQGRQKSDVIADFHRFLARASSGFP
jgi:DNA-binding NarL/FixJ family response regulator